jgi:enoyl-[acyl-carrier protein] reductase I
MIMTTEERKSIEIPQILKGKVALVSGVANKRSIAWAIAQALDKAGAKIVFSYQGERIKEAVEELASSINNSNTIECDVSSNDQINSAFKFISENYDNKLDILVHCLAFAPRETLQGGYVNTEREHFSISMDISAYSLAAMSKAARPLMNNAGGGSIITLSYLGAEQVIPNYNMMGVSKAALEAGVRYLAYDLGPENIRVNAISAGPVKTLAARGISDFTKMLSFHEQKAPMRRNVDLEEIAGAAVFLASPLSGAITGEVLHVDCGFSIMAMPAAALD